MATVRIVVFWTVALLGAVKIHEPPGVPGLVAWTAGAMAVSHSKSWRGPFPGEDERDDHRSSGCWARAGARRSPEPKV
jgi:hypothetical protein